MKSHPFAVGVLVGVAGVWAWHHFIHPIPGAAKSPIIS